MAENTYNSPQGRINQIKGEMLAVAEPHEVLGLGLTQKRMPRNKGDNITYRARIPHGGSAATSASINRWSVNAAQHLVQEGVTPTPEKVDYREVNVRINQYACLYMYTDKAADLHEDDIPGDQVTQTGERMGMVREMIRYGVLKAASNVLYVGGTTRATVNKTIGINALSQMSRTLQANGAQQKTKILAPGPNYGTQAIEAGFIVFCHTDLEHDIRQLAGFTPVAEYGTRSPINEHELGAVGRFRFLTSKELVPYLDAGAAIGSTGLVSTSGVNIDVYPMIVMAEDAAFDVALNTNFEITHIKTSTKTKEDPFGQRGYVGAIFWSAALVANPGWMGVIEVGITNLG